MAKRNKQQKAKKKIKYSRHHIIPKSRGGTNALENIAQLTQKKHRDYHTLFGNRTPEEIVPYLVTDFWNNHWHYAENSRQKYINNVLDRHYNEN